MAELEAYSEPKLRIFIGSSTEYEAYAEQVAACIEKAGGEAKLWTDDGLFPAGEYTWDRLRQLVLQFDGAIFIFGCDDKIEHRGEKGYQPRDNVLIEFGLFSGRLPRQAVVFCRVGESRTPIDLDGFGYINDKEGNFGHSVQLEVKDWFSNLKTIGQDAADEINSIFPFIEFKDDDKKIPRVRRFSNSSRGFYGYADHADLSYKTVKELIDNLRPFIDPPAPHWDDFLNDQDSVIAKYKSGGLPLAQIPICFNKQHRSFPGRTFVPLIAESNGKEGYGITRILYLDIASLPKGVLNDSAWLDLSENIDMEKLSIELKQIADNWIRDTPEVARGRIKALTDAAEEAAKGGSIKVVYYCGEAGRYAVRGLAQKGCYPNAKLLLCRMLALTD